MNETTSWRKFSLDIEATHAQIPFILIRFAR